MLKPTEPLPSGEERPIGDIVSDLVDDGKAYARAELNLAKAIASSKAAAFKAPMILLVAAALIGMAALNALAVAIFILLAMVMSPLLAAVLDFVLVGGTAALLGWLGVEKLRKLL
jgi:hypothetical protein